MRWNGLRYLIREGFRNIWVNRLMSMASVGVLVSCLLMIGGSLLFSLNVNKLMAVAEDQNVVMVFVEDIQMTDEDGKETLDVQKTNQRIAALETKLNNNDNIANVVFVSREEALRQLMGKDEENYDKALGSEWMPASYRVTLVDLKEFDQTLAEIEAMPEVEDTRSDRRVVDFFVGLHRTISTVGTGLIGTQLLISLFIISNTIRITMHARKLEIRIMKAVGATNWFIRLPFILEGGLLGIFSGLLTLLMLNYVYKWLADPIFEQLPLADFSTVPFASVSGKLLAGFLSMGVLAGVLGSVMSIRKYLKNEGSDFSAV